MIAAGEDWLFSAWQHLRRILATILSSNVSPLKTFTLNVVSQWKYHFTAVAVPSQRAQSWPKSGPHTAADTHLGLNGPYRTKTITQSPAYSSWNPFILGCSLEAFFHPFFFCWGGGGWKITTFLCLHPKFPLMSFTCFLATTHWKGNLVPGDTGKKAGAQLQNLCLCFKQRETHYMHVWNDICPEGIQEGHMKNVEPELCSVSEEKGKRVVFQGWLVIGGAFRPPLFKFTVKRRLHLRSASICSPQLVSWSVSEKSALKLSPHSIQGTDLHTNGDGRYIKQK